LNAVLDALGEQGYAEIKETPLSWVILTERHAFKMKKSVTARDAHFRSLAKRRQSCSEEAWRNERLAPGVYLGVVAITKGRDGKLRLGGHGEEVEWLVKMRRLPADRNLKTLIHSRQVCRSEVVGLARALTAFYRGAPPQTENVEQLCARIQRRINENAKVLVQRLPAKFANAVRRLREIQRDFLNRSRMVLNLRVCDGRIVDGHGELLPEHVFLERQPVVIGCVAYSPRQRAVDALDDLALLAVDCEHYGRDDIADEIMTVYRQTADDDGFPHLEAFYKSLHACQQSLRACTSLDLERMSHRQLMDQVTRYLEQAKQYAINLV
jgi:aminoglycoside phosphotransferase family enzyme